jgi:hypothetical protein
MSFISLPGLYLGPVQDIEVDSAVDVDMEKILSLYLGPVEDIESESGK